MKTRSGMNDGQNLNSYPAFGIGNLAQVSSLSYGVMDIGKKVAQLH